MNEVSIEDRRAIYVAAWRVYTATSSNEYAVERALDEAWKRKVRASIAREIIREAIDDVNDEMRKFLSTLKKQAEDRAKKYSRNFPENPLALSRKRR